MDSPHGCQTALSKRSHETGNKAGQYRSLLWHAFLAPIMMTNETMQCLERQSDVELM